MTLQRVDYNDEVAVICVDACFCASGLVVRLRQGVGHGEQYFLTDRPPLHGTGKGAANEGYWVVALLFLGLSRILLWVLC